MNLEQTNEPLLYIDQPKFVKPQVNMQTIFETNSTPTVNKQAHVADCSIEEKIHYLLHLATGIPSVKVEVVTEQEKFIGKLTKADTTKIYLETYRRREIVILKTDIKALHLKSFN